MDVRAIDKALNFFNTYGATPERLKKIMLDVWGAKQPQFWFTGQPHPLNEEDARLYAEAQKAQANPAPIQ